MTQTKQKQEPGKVRRSRYQMPVRPKKSRRKLVGVNVVLLGTVTVSAVVTGILIGAFFAFSRDLPQIEGLKTFKPSTVSRVYSSDDVLLGEFFEEKRDPLPLSKIPRKLISAVIETEDQNFYDHTGIDLRGIIRALYRDIMARDFVEGASTISQQLARTLFLKSDKTMHRKTQEAVLAFQLERRYTKDEILELYLNQVYFGSGAYGVESAANIFFGKSADQLTLSECALIAAMPKAPSRYSPLINPDLAKDRRNQVLKTLWRREYISKKEYETLIAEPVVTDKGFRRKIKAPYFVEHVKKEMEAMVGTAQLYKNGYTIRTTLSSELQDAMEKAAEKNVAALEKRMKRRKKKASPQTAAISIDVETGGVLAMVGGRNFFKSPFNRATQAKRQPGSSFKPFVYAAAIDKGSGQNRLIMDTPISYSMGTRAGLWTPDNYDRQYEGQMTLRRALDHSRNIPAIRLLDKVGPSEVVALAARLGIKSNLEPNLSLALGTSVVTLYELTSAYAVFAANGVRIAPYAIESVTDRSGRQIFKAAPRKQNALSPQTAAIVADMLTGVIKEGTGWPARKMNKPVAGKTGTTDQYKDALFVGFSPRVATGVWVGCDDNTPIGSGETGAEAALPAWIGTMETAFKIRPSEKFTEPPGVVRVPMSLWSGQVLSGEAKGPGIVWALVRKSAPEDSE